MGPAPPVTVARPRVGVRSVELRYRNGYATGVVATAQMDRFLSFGVNLNRHSAGVWYRVPPASARTIRRLAATLRTTPLPAGRGVALPLTGVARDMATGTCSAR
jgi:hypothetical protein